MEPLFNELTESEAKSVVGGRLLSNPGFLEVYATAKAKGKAVTNFIDTGYPRSANVAETYVTDVSSEGFAQSDSGIFYSDSPV